MANINFMSREDIKNKFYNSPALQAPSPGYQQPPSHTKQMNNLSFSNDMNMLKDIANNPAKQYDGYEWDDNSLISYGFDPTEIARLKGGNADLQYLTEQGWLKPIEQAQVPYGGAGDVDVTPFTNNSLNPDSIGVKSNLHTSSVPQQPSIPMQGMGDFKAGDYPSIPMQGMGDFKAGDYPSNRNPYTISNQAPIRNINNDGSYLPNEFGKLIMQLLGK